MNWFYIILIAFLTSIITTAAVSCLLGPINNAMKMLVSLSDSLSSTNMILARSLAEKNGDTQGVENFDKMIKSKLSEMEQLSKQ